MVSATSVAPFIEIQLAVSFHSCQQMYVTAYKKILLCCVNAEHITVGRSYTHIEFLAGLEILILDFWSHLLILQP